MNRQEMAALKIQFRIPQGVGGSTPSGCTITKSAILYGTFCFSGDRSPFATFRPRKRKKALVGGKNVTTRKMRPGHITETSDFAGKFSQFAESGHTEHL